MSDALTAAEIEELERLLEKAGDERWAVDPDDRPDMEYNNHIVLAEDTPKRPHRWPGMTIAFMAHDGRAHQDEFEAKAELIVAMRNAIDRLLSSLKLSGGSAGKGNTSPPRSRQMATEPMLCPFCGAQPYVADPTNFPGDWEHPYEHKGCFLDGFHITDHTAWNRRRTPPSTAGWRPISTAPKDGTYFLAYPVFGPPCEVSEVCWRQLKRSGHWESHGLSAPILPTHWQPLPPAPSQEGAAEGEGE